ncbi:tol-pal system protein YbgF [Sulfuricystis multivorans]|uniref:tol-pal system protein YbgF n=1 Tax=Sulfuricystis multivorans TaxID=2211108 RepID=UPI000F8434C7|nr:tol-pal system protein YbgF [Sulfuricystis multivorans]
MKRHVWLACLALALPFCARAGMFDDEEARRQIRELRAETMVTLDGLRQRVDALAKNQLDFTNQIEVLRAEIARLTGQVEVLTNSLEAAHKRQQDFYVDLDARLRKLESLPAAQTAAAQEAPAPAAQQPADPQAEMRDYEAALSLFRGGKYKEAQAAFEAFIAAYPKSTLLPNATYWLGSSHYQQRQFDKAAELYGKVAAGWPNDPKTPDALLARANAQVQAKDVKGAIQTLEALIQKYPTSAAAENGRTRLKTLAPKKR